MSIDFAHWDETFRAWTVASAESDPAHDLQHIERVVLNVRRLAGEVGLGLEVLLPAAWLHDCVHVCKTSPDRSRASLLAADRAVEMLREWEYPAKHFDGIHHAIHAHSFSADVATETPEAMVLQDADRLDAVGAVGLARCLMLGGHFGSQLYSPDDPFCEKREPADKDFCVDHFYAKLLGLEKTMKTAAGRALARERTAFLRTFLTQLRSEIS